MYQVKRVLHSRRLWFAAMALTTITVLALQPATQALTPKERRDYANQGIYFVDRPCLEGSPQSPGCSCGVGSVTLSQTERYEATWNFFKDKGLSEEATAGLMGNLQAESLSINPHQLQIAAETKELSDNWEAVQENPDDIQPSYQAPQMPTVASSTGPLIAHPIIRAKFGYGIAQWTSPGRQDGRQADGTDIPRLGLQEIAEQSGRSTGDLGLQLDFLWQELEENYTGVLAVLQEPGVTIETASYTVLKDFETPRPFTSEGTEEQRQSTTASRLAISKKIFSDHSGKSFGTSVGAGCALFGSAIDLVSEDTSHIPCTNGTQDAGVVDGYRQGALIRIRICLVNGVPINSQIAGAIKQMMTDTKAAGVPLGLGNSFRTMEQQIAVHAGWCAYGDRPQKKLDGSWNSCSGAARPGYSNHQQGLAIDFVCNGSWNVRTERYYDDALRSANVSRCFRWLLDNGLRYGLYEFNKGEGNKLSGGYEAWHWSVNGN